METLIGTADGVHTLGSDGPPLLEGHQIDALSPDGDGWWALSDGSTVWNLAGEDTPTDAASIDEARINCLLPRQWELLLGAEAGQLFHLATPGDGQPADLAVDTAFATAPGRSDWYTPWGGPPDVRSMAGDVDGTVYLNVHVGGILRYRDDDPVWRDTMDIDADVHEVIAHPDMPGTALAATARGVAISRDGADSWTFHTDGLHAAYCRAVAVSGDRVFVSASRSNRGENAAVYRTDLTGADLQRCEDGLPEWFSTNINTRCLQAIGDAVVIGDRDGTVYQSADGGDTWAVAATGLPNVRCVAIG